MPNVPPKLPNVVDKAATAIVRQVEDQKKIEQIAKQKAEQDRQRREQAMRDAEAAKRNQGTNKR